MQGSVYNVERIVMDLIYLLSAGKFLRLASTPDPPRPVPPPGLGLASRLKLYLKYDPDGSALSRIVSRSAVVGANSSDEIKS